MESIMLIAGEVVLLMAVVFVGYLTILFYRAPGRAKWLENDTASTTVMIVMMAGGIFSLAWLVSGFVQLGFNPLLATAAAGGLFGLTIWGFWKLLRMHDRLAAAAEGRSPFALKR